MKIKLPKPLHGWREFFGEVGIIVLGVLIALGAQQLVEDVNARIEMRRAEAAMRLELAENNGPQAYARVLIASCLDRQLVRIRDQAERALRSRSESGRPIIRRRFERGTAKPGT